MLIRQLGPVLKGLVVVSQVLIQSVLRGIHLKAVVAFEGDLWRPISWDRFSRVRQMHGILSQDYAFVFPFGHRSAQRARAVRG